MQFNDAIYNIALTDLHDIVISMGGKQLTEYGLPQPQAVDDNMFAQIYRREIEMTRESSMHMLYHYLL